LEQIERLEKERRSLEKDMSCLGFFEQEQNIVIVANKKLKELNNAIQELFIRWEELESKDIFK